VVCGPKAGNPGWVLELCLPPSVIRLVGVSPGDGVAIWCVKSRDALPAQQSSEGARLWRHRGACTSSVGGLRMQSWRMPEVASQLCSDNGSKFPRKHAFDFLENDSFLPRGGPRAGRKVMYVHSVVIQKWLAA